MLDEHKQFCADRTREVVDLYLQQCSEPGNKDRSAWELRTILEQKYEKPIKPKTIKTHYTKCVTRAFYLNFTDRYEIYIAAGFTPVVQKYYLTRELFHIVVDKPEFRTSDLVGHVNNMHLRASPESDPAIGRPTIAETLAQIAATEFLIPFADRVALRKEDGNTDFAKAAETYNVPIWAVERSTTKEYMADLAKFFGI